MILAGVDGYKNGWVVIWDCNGTTSVECVDNLQDILERKPQIAIVDIPIGLLEIGTREADDRARGFLKKRSCCVFTAPTRPMLECDSYLQHNAGAELKERASLNKPGRSSPR